MSRRQQVLLRFPRGANDSADPGLLPEARAALMLGISPNQAGSGSRTFWKKRVQRDADFLPSGRINGVFQYTGLTAADDHYVEVKDGVFYTCQISANAPTATINALNFTSTQLAAVNDDSGVTFDADARVRAVQIGTEMVFVQEGGVEPVRYDGTNIYKLGIDAPSSPTDGGNAVYVGSAPSLTVGADYQYAVTYADSFGRESSPSGYLSVTMGAGGGRVINWSAPTDAQVDRIFLYRTNAGGATLYRVVEAGFSIGTTTYNDTAVNDTLLVFNSLAPLVGQNDPPLPASLIAIYKNRIVLNGIADPRLLQVSNEDEPGSFSQIGPLYNENGQLLNATDGITIDVLNEYGDEITGLGHLGSVLGVWCRRTTAVFEGNSPAEYQFRIVHRVGCIAPDSICECGNMTPFMAEDGVYALDYESGFSITKLSEDYDNLFRSASVLWDPPGTWPPSQVFGREERAQAASAIFLQNRYVLATPPWTYVYDFDTGGSYLDTMTGMPYDNDDGASNGYNCLSRVFADRQYQVGLYSPGIGANTPIGDLYVMSFYPLTQDSVGTPEPFSCTYMTRALDGAGVSRSRLKRFHSVKVFGTLLPMTEADGTVTASPLMQGTISLVLENGLYTFPPSDPYYFDNLEQVGTNFVGRYFPRDQLRGVLFEQDFPADAVGRLGQILIQFTTVNALLTVSDLICEYTPLDS